MYHSPLPLYKHIVINPRHKDGCRLHVLAVSWERRLRENQGELSATEGQGEGRPLPSRAVSALWEALHELCSVVEVAWQRMGFVVRQRA